MKRRELASNSELGFETLAQHCSLSAWPTPQCPGTLFHEHPWATLPPCQELSLSHRLLGHLALQYILLPFISHFFSHTAYCAGPELFTNFLIHFVCIVLTVECLTPYLWLAVMPFLLLLGLKSLELCFMCNDYIYQL